MLNRRSDRHEFKGGGCLNKEKVLEKVKTKMYNPCCKTPYCTVCWTCGPYSSCGIYDPCHKFGTCASRSCYGLCDHDLCCYRYRYPYKSSLYKYRSLYHSKYCCCKYCL